MSHFIKMISICINTFVLNKLYYFQRMNYLKQISLIALLVLTVISCNQEQTKPIDEQPNEFYPNSKPCTRWWWFATEIKKPDIKYQLDWAKENNFGGVEVCPNPINVNLISENIINYNFVLIRFYKTSCRIPQNSKCYDKKSYNNFIYYFYHMLIFNRIFISTNYSKCL